MSACSATGAFSRAHCCSLTSSSGCWCVVCVSCRSTAKTSRRVRTRSRTRSCSWKLVRPPHGDTHRRSAIARADDLPSDGWCARAGVLLTRLLLVGACASRACSSSPVDIREELESTTSLSVLTRLASANRAALTSVYQSLEAAHRARDVPAMRQLTIQLSYLQNIETEVYKKMPIK